MVYRYREHFHLSYKEALDEPWEAIEQAHLVFPLEHERDKLEEKRREQQQRRPAS